MSSLTSLRTPGSGPQHVAVGTAETDRQLTDSTRLIYSADMAAFIAWCASVGRRPLPATPETVTEYVAHLTVTPSPQTGRPLAPGSINRILTAVRAAHRGEAVPAPETEGARKVLSGYRARLAAAKIPAEARIARPRRAGPSTPDALHEILATLDQETLIGKRDAALLLLGYACTAHVSEPVSLDQADAVETDTGLLVTLYRRPLKPHDKVAVPYGPTPATCPVWAVRALLAALKHQRGAPTGRCSSVSISTTASPLQWPPTPGASGPRPAASPLPSRPPSSPALPCSPTSRGSGLAAPCAAGSTLPPAAPAERRSRRLSRRSRGADSATGGGRRARC